MGRFALIQPERGFIVKRLYSIFLFLSISIICVLSQPFRSSALALPAGGLLIEEIMSLILTTANGSYVSSNDIFGNKSDPLDLEGFQAYLDYLNTQDINANVGDVVGSYVERAQYLQPGNQLIMSDDDFNKLVTFGQNHSFQYSENTDFVYSDEVYNNLIKNIRAFSGFQSSNENALKSYLQNHSGEPLFISVFSKGLYHYCYIYSGTPYLDVGNPFSYIRGIQSACYCYRYNNNVINWTLENYSFISLGNDGVDSLSGIDSIQPAIKTFQDTKIKNAIDLGFYNVLTRDRTLSQDGTIIGDVAITIPWASALREQIKVGNLEDIYGLIHVVPITGDVTKTLVYNPAISAYGYKVSEQAISIADMNYLIQGESDSYTMDLTQFFPFCIPFDVVDFCRQFQATPEAPSITFPFPYIANGGGVAYIEKTFDLSQFDNVAQLVRRLELVAFIVGLAFVTRNFFIRG